LEFKTDDAAKMAAQNLDALDIEALVVIGGDGSFRGAHHLGNHWQGQIIGLPGTIDNDIYGTDATIGYYTAIETAVSSIDKVRDTADAFERIFLVEVMGRHAGFIALNAAIASASDHVVVPEIFQNRETAMAQMLAELEYRREHHGSSSYIVVIAENVWPDGLSKLAEELEERTGSEVRPVILGHVQRGGSPVPQDRILASKLGVHAAKAIQQGKTDIMIGERNGMPVEVSLSETWQKQKPLEPFCVEAMQQLVNATTD
jgi:6-phosphofructokinase 1